MGFKMVDVLFVKICNKSSWLLFLSFPLFVLFGLCFPEESRGLDITSKNFPLLIEKMSEPDGSYEYENWTTNEPDYLRGVDLIKKYNITGGVYIGVGPDQNFTFIEAVRPELAFIVDIRKQNTMLHLVYKILFEISENRISFFSKLFSRNVHLSNQASEDLSIDEILALFKKAYIDKTMTETTACNIQSLLGQKYGFVLKDKDRFYIHKILRFFRESGVDICCDTDEETIHEPPNPDASKRYMTFAEVFTKVNESGQQLNAFASEAKYSYLRQMQLDNKIIPLTGDFSGSVTLSKIAAFLKQKKKTVRSFYVSSVEWYLVKNKNVFDSWVENIKGLPIDSDSVFLRHSSYYPNLVMDFSKMFYEFRLQRIAVFLKHFTKIKDINHNSIWLTEYLP